MVTPPPGPQIQRVISDFTVKYRLFKSFLCLCVAVCVCVWLLSGAHVNLTYREPIVSSATFATVRLFKVNFPPLYLCRFTMCSLKPWKLCRYIRVDQDNAPYV